MLDRRQALLTLGAASAGILAAAVPDVLQSGTPTAQAHSGHPGPSGTSPSPPHPSRKDPAYAKGVRPLDPTKPIHNLHDLTPAAPANAIALTLDDGPHPIYTPMMLDLLAEFQVPATFSVIGKQVTETPALVRRLVDAGHQISNHTVTHPLNLPHLTSAKITSEILGCLDRISQTTSVLPKFFRSPGGNWSPQVLEIATANGMTCVDWRVDPRDWDQPRSTVAHISQTLLTAQAGDILLSHDGGGVRKRTIEALRIVIPALKAKGFVFVAL